MIVTTGASNGQAKKGFAENVELVFDPVGIVLLGVGRGVHGLVKIPKTRPDNGLVEFALGIKSRLIHQISGNVLDQKLVVRQVVIESPDQIVPVFMGMLQGVIEFVPASLGITNQVHPMTGPLFSEMGTDQKFVHDLVEGIGIRVVQKGFDLIGTRRQTDQIEIHTPYPSSPVGGQRRQDPLLRESGLDKSVQGPAD